MHDVRPPVFWPTLTAAEAEDEWPALRNWVTGLGERFPHAARLPLCWWRHNELVELLSALRDCERGCYAPTAAPTAAMDWHRAWREAESRLEAWVKRLTCAAPGRDHPADDRAWQSFVAADVVARTPPAIDSETAPGPFPRPRPLLGDTTEDEGHVDEPPTTG